MISSINDTRGSITRSGNVLRINHALVEETSAPGRPPHFLLVSYTRPNPNGISSIGSLQLNIGDDTLIMNSFGMQLRFEDIQVGSWIDVRFLPQMTRSIPPQTQALLIIVQETSQPGTSITTTGHVASFDPVNNLLYTGNPRNMNSQTRYVITNTTTITDRYGNQIPLREIQPGQAVRINHANFQTAGIPPQATAFSVQQL